MKSKKHAFRPSVGDKLEERVVLSKTANLVVNAFQNFTTQLDAQRAAKTATLAVRIADVNALGHNIVHILGNSAHSRKIVRENVTGAADPNSVDFTDGAVKGSLQAALLGKKFNLVNATNRAEINILKSI